MNILNNFPWGLGLFFLLTIVCLGTYIYIIKIRKIKITKILIFGSKGKMGSFLVKRLSKYEIIEVDIEDNLVDKLKEKPDLIIDFSTKDASINMIRMVLPYNIPVISGVTGFTNIELEEISKLARGYYTSVIMKPNFSYGIKYILDNLKIDNNSNFEVELNEYHHIDKKDAPSGTSKLISRYYNIPISKINSYRTEDYLTIHEIIIKNSNEEIKIIHQVFNKEAYIEEIEAAIEKIKRGLIIDINY